MKRVKRVMFSPRYVRPYVSMNVQHLMSRNKPALMNSSSDGELLSVNSTDSTRIFMDLRGSLWIFLDVGVRQDPPGSFFYCRLFTFRGFIPSVSSSSSSTFSERQEPKC